MSVFVASNADVEKVNVRYCDGQGVGEICAKGRFGTLDVETAATPKVITRLPKTVAKPGDIMPVPWPRFP